MMKDTIARQPFCMMIMYTMDVHKQEVMIHLGVTMFGAMTTGAIVEIALQVSFSSTNLKLVQVLSFKYEAITQLNIII